MRLSEEFRNSLATMAASYQASFQGDTSAAKAAQSYLSGRGIDMQTASGYEIGVVNTQFDEHADYAGMICFPYPTKLGGIVSLKFRQAHDCTKECRHQKYLTPYPTRIYNTPALDVADRLGWVCITEGEIDAITLEALCPGWDELIPAVGIPGADTWGHHPEWKELFRGYTKVYVFQDDDPPQCRCQPKHESGEACSKPVRPGAEFVKAITHDLDTAEVVKLPGKDVNDTYRRFGPNVIKERIGL